jgi:hypothetical protein
VSFGTEAFLFYLFSKGLLLEVVDFRSRCSLSLGRAVSFLGARKDPINGVIVLLRLQEKQQRSKLPRRMPCEKNTQVVGTLIP